MEREVAHVFRPYPGFINARLLPKTSKTGRKYFFCFVDFEDETLATICLKSLQGYRFHKNDSKGLKISYATPTHVVKGQKKRRRSRSRSKSVSE